MINRWFLVVNLALLLLYGWTLTEEAAVQVQVSGDVCTAVFPERANRIRTSSIPCPGLQGGFVGLYFSNTNENPFDWGPLDWLAPRSGWRSVIFTQMQGNRNRLGIKVADEVPGWRRVWGEWLPVWKTAVMRWQTPIYSDYLIETNLRRPSETAGILLLEANREDGWAFITTPDKRRGVWWEWQDGRPTHPIIGIPFQKTTLAQVQSLLRRALRAHQAALLLLLTGWLLSKIMGRRLTRMNTDFPLSRHFPRSLRFIFQPQPITLLITLLTLAATVYIASDVLERIPHVQDSITYLFQAKMLARGSLWADAPPLPEFFEHEFLIVRDGRWFGQYAPGFPAVLAIGVLLGQPWLVNPLLATLTIPLLYLLGQALYGRSTGLITITLALVSPFFLFMSGSLMAHAAELFWVVLFMISWVYAIKPNGKRRWALLAGAALGMLFLTRQATAVAVGLPFLAVTGLMPQSFRSVIVKGSWLLMTAVPLASLFFLNQYALTGHPFRDPRLLERPFDRLGFGEDVGEGFNVFSLSESDDQIIVDWFTDPSQPPRGHTLARGIHNLEQNWRALEMHLFGWLPIFTLAFVWLAFLLKRPSWENISLLAPIIGTLIVYLFFWADGIMYGPRYFYGALPALFILTARGIQAAADGIGGRAGQIAITIIVLLLVSDHLIFYLPYQLAVHRGYNFVDAQPRAQLEVEIEGKALVFVDDIPVNWWKYGRFFSGNTPWLDGRLIYARDLGDEENGRLLPHFPDYTPYRWHNGQLELLK